MKTLIQYMKFFGAYSICIICLQDFRVEDMKRRGVVMVPCGDVMHITCIIGESQRVDA